MSTWVSVFELICNSSLRRRAKVMEGGVVCLHGATTELQGVVSLPPLSQLPRSQLPRSTPQVGPGSGHKHSAQDPRRSLYSEAFIIKPQEGSSTAD